MKLTNREIVDNLFEAMYEACKDDPDFFTEEEKAKQQKFVDETLAKIKRWKRTGIFK